MKIDDVENKLFIANHTKRYFMTADDIDITDTNNSFTYIAKEITENSTVLDVGCSYGYFGEWLVKNKGCKVLGIDIDKNAIQHARQRGYYRDIFTINLDCLGANPDEYKRFTDLTNKSIDYIVCADILEHLKDPTGVLSLLTPKLKFNGSILISIPNIGHIDVILNLLLGKFSYTDFGILDNTHLRFFTKYSFLEWIECINDLFEDSGYKLVTKYLGSTLYYSNLQQQVKANYPRLYNSLLEINPELEISQFIFALKKVNTLKL